MVGSEQSCCHSGQSFLKLLNLTSTLTTVFYALLMMKAIDG